MGCKVLCPSFALLAYLMICEHVRAQCSQPSFTSKNVVLKAEYLLTQSFQNGESVTFECVIGHKPADPKASKSITCAENRWTDLDFSCIKKSCGALPDILHGRYEMSGNLFGDTAKPVCNTGYMLAGQETTRTCRDGGWDGRDPLCEPVKCPAPPTIENGEPVDVPLESYDYSQAVSYRCNGGFSLIGESTVHCSEDGTFKPNPPTCFDGCPTPTVSNARRIDGKAPPYKISNFVKYKCDDSYVMEGDAYIVCRETGWTPKPPRCIGPCSSPVLGEHVTLTQEFRSQKTFPHGSSVTVECIPGYEPLDSVSRSITCKETNWSELRLTCKALPTTTTATTAATSTTLTTSKTSPKNDALPTTTTATTAATSKTRTTSKAVPKNDEEEETPGPATSTWKCVVGILGGICVAGLLGFAGYYVYCRHTQKRSKRQLSDKMDSNNHEELL